MNNVFLYLIKLLLKRSYYDKYKDYVLPLVSDVQELKKIWFVLEDYYLSFEKDISSVENLEMLFYTAYPMIRNKEIPFYREIFENLKKSSPDETFIEKYIAEGQKNQLATELALKALDVAEGRLGPEMLTPYIESLSAYSGAIKQDLKLVPTDINGLLDRNLHSPGLKWRLDCLNKSLGPLRKGDFGFVFKRPETGGTTFLASEVSFFAGQVERPILWFNNEEQTEKVILRCMQSALGCRVIDLDRDREGSQQRYTHITSGNIFFPDFGICDINTIGSYCDSYNPALVVIDQIDKVKGFKEDRKDLEYGQIYRWVRELAKRHCPIIGVCQASGSAENKMWLSMEDIAESKTSKAAEADWILGIGAVDDIGKKNLRYFNICKNKLMGGPDSDPSMRHGRMSVVIQPEIARYKDSGDYEKS